MRSTGMRTVAIFRLTGPVPSSRPRWPRAPWPHPRLWPRPPRDPTGWWRTTGWWPGSRARWRSPRARPATTGSEAPASPHRGRHGRDVGPVPPPLVTRAARGPQVGVLVGPAVLAGDDVIHVAGPPLAPGRHDLTLPPVTGQDAAPGPHPLTGPPQIGAAV